MPNGTLDTIRSLNQYLFPNQAADFEVMLHRYPPILLHDLDDLEAKMKFLRGFIQRPPSSGGKPMDGGGGIWGGIVTFPQYFTADLATYIGVAAAGVETLCSFLRGNSVCICCEDSGVGLCGASWGLRQSRRNDRNKHRIMAIVVSNSQSSQCSFGSSGRQSDTQGNKTELSTTPRSQRYVCRHYYDSVYPQALAPPSSSRSSRACSSAATWQHGSSSPTRSLQSMSWG